MKRVITWFRHKLNWFTLAEVHQQYEDKYEAAQLALLSRHVELARFEEKFDNHCSKHDPFMQLASTKGVEESIEKMRDVLRRKDAKLEKMRCALDFFKQELDFSKLRHMEQNSFQCVNP